MQFLVDAHLPMRLVFWLRERGHDVIHTRELPRKNETEDMDIIQLAVAQNRTVISKYEDFYKYFILKGQPPKLLMLTMGNIVNKDLITLFEKNIDQIEADLANHKVVELSNATVTVHF
ncbi:MAG: DUF5615 family PIN-like protein [Bacteroidota bacterium]